MLKELKKIGDSSDQEQFVSFEIRSLIKQVHRSVAENKKIWNEIQLIDHNFNHKLYQPIQHQGIDQMFLRPLILRQIDQLMEEKQNLLKKKQVLIFMKNEETNKEQSSILNNSNHYSFLRTTWNKFQTKNENASQKIDNLNKIVSLVRNNIKSLANNEQAAILSELLNERQKNLYIDSIKNDKNRETIELLNMRNQELQMKNYELKQIIDIKNKKIQTLQTELGLVQNRIKQSIQTLHLTGQKLTALKKSKHNLQSEVKRLNNIENQNTYTIFSGHSESLKVRIQASTLKEVKLQNTNKSLNQLLQFLRSTHYKQRNKNIQPDQSNPELLVPSLNFNQRVPSNQASLTGRLMINSAKFIPMRTQRPYSNKTCALKSFNSLIVSQSIEQAEEFGIVESSNGIKKRISTKGELPLTSDRTGNHEIQNLQ